MPMAPNTTPRGEAHRFPSRRSPLLLGAALIASLLVAACGSSSEQTRAVPYTTWNPIPAGTPQREVERRLPPPETRTHSPDGQTCLGWELVGQKRSPDGPALIACFKNGVLYSKGLRDPPS